MPEKFIFTGEDIKFTDVLEGGWLTLNNFIFLVFGVGEIWTINKKRRKSAKQKRGCEYCCERFLFYCAYLLLFFTFVLFPASILWIWVWTYFFSPTYSWLSILPFFSLSLYLYDGEFLASFVVLGFYTICWLFFVNFNHFFIICVSYSFQFLIWSCIIFIFAYILSSMYFYYQSKRLFKKATIHARKINLDLQKDCIRNMQKIGYEPIFQHSLLKELKRSDHEMYDLTLTLLQRDGFEEINKTGVCNYGGRFLEYCFIKSCQSKNLQILTILKDVLDRDTAGVVQYFLIPTKAGKTSWKVYVEKPNEYHSFGYPGLALTKFFRLESDRPKMLYDSENGFAWLDWGYEKYKEQKLLNTGFDESQENSGKCSLM